MNLENLISEGKYRLPFKPFKDIIQCPAPSHKKFGDIHCIDWGMPIGTPIYAARAGKIRRKESRYNTHGGEECREIGNGVEIYHDNNEVSVYAHLMWRGVVVKKGQKVKAGQLIGYSGQTGFATYPHLHFGVYRLINDDFINVKIRF